MGTLMVVIDVALFFFFALMAVFIPLINGQIVLPGIYPKFLTNLKNWYSSVFNDYLFTETPHFFIGLVWLDLLFLWPLSIANIYAILTGKLWFGTTCLLYGASLLTSMGAILGDMIGSGKVTNRLLLAYLPSMGIAILAILRGLASHSTQSQYPLFRPG